MLPTQQRLIWFEMLTVPRMRNPGLERPQLGFLFLPGVTSAQQVRSSHRFPRAAGETKPQSTLFKSPPALCLPICHQTKQTAQPGFIWERLHIFTYPRQVCFCYLKAESYLNWHTEKLPNSWWLSGSWFLSWERPVLGSAPWASTRTEYHPRVSGCKQQKSVSNLNRKELIEGDNVG